VTNKKPLSLVYQVLNFIFDDISTSYKLSLNEEKLLISLARYNGKKGICPSLTTVAKKMKRAKRNIIRTLSLLEKKNLVSLQRLNGKKSFYSITLPLDEFRSTGDTRITGDTGITAPVIRVTQTGDTGITTRERKRENTEERESALSVFLPDDQNLILCTELKLEVQEELESFRNRYKGNVSQYEFSRWLKNSHSYKIRKIAPNEGTRANEPRNAIKEFGPGHPEWERRQEWEKKHGSKISRNNSRGSFS